MMRLLVPIALTLAGGLVSGCSGGYHVDAAQYRQSQVATADVQPRRTTVAAPAPVPAPLTRTVGAGLIQNDGTVGDATQIRPWPKRGTPEYERLQAQESEQEKRVKDAVNSICRGC
jgi:hypothetical protein